MLKLLWNYFLKFINIKFSKIKTWYSQHVQFMQSYTSDIDLSDSVYEDLAPKDDIEKSESYTYALDWALSNDKILNIALTGSYGSGKSSILRTYEKKRAHYHYLNISLATFYNQNESHENVKIENDSPIVDKVSNDFDDLEIEKSILQQLFYKVRSGQIPYSRFRKIRNLKASKVIIQVSLVLVALILGLILFMPSIIANLQKNITTLDNYVNSRTLIGVGYVTFFVLTLYLVITFIRYLNGRVRLSKITLQKAELELDKASNESILNKYLDEILYFFEVTKYNIVLIEDLDRFNNTRIFIKLRELNSLINNCEQIKRRIIFIYAIKDDMFINNERTKFFDFIIPVIPVINSTNSSEKLLEKIRQNDLGQDISDEFINGVSIYIDDMRILNNIYNEFILYKNILTDVSLKSQQILALVIYKNLYPNDFAELQYNRGITFKAFNNKKDFITRKVLEIQEKRHELEERLNRANQDCLSSIKELKAAFLYNLAGRVDRIDEVRINRDKRYSPEQILRDDFDLSLLEKDNLIVIYNNNSVSSSMDSANQKSGSDYTYIQRIEGIKIKSKAKQEQLKQEIDKMRNDERILSTLTLKDLINRFEITDVLDESVLKEKLVIYLLRNGYIDESYPNYLTHFYPNSLTAQDMNFILGVRNHEKYEFNYHLTKIERVISKLNWYEFEQKEALNFDLFEFLLDNNAKFKTQIDAIIKQISDETPASISFIDEFKDITKNKNLFWEKLCHEWHNVWLYIEDNSNFATIKKDLYLKNIIEFAQVSDIEIINSDGKLADYISCKDTFLQLILNIDLSKSKEVICNLNIKFKAIEVAEVAEELLNYVLEHDFYIINIKMIETILHAKAPTVNSIIETSNLSAILKAGYLPLINYVDKNIEQYLDNVFMKLDTNKYENMDTIIELLKKEGITDNNKIKIIAKEEFQLLDISAIPKTLWDTIIENFRIKVTWDNVFTYYKKVEKFNDQLIEFLNSEHVYTTLSLSEFQIDDDKDGASSNFCDKLIVSPITEKAFEYLVNSIPYTYSDCDIEGISPRRVDILISQNILKFTVENYNHLRKDFSNKHITFIEKHYKEYLNGIEKYSIDSNDLLFILKLSCFSGEEILQIISSIDLSILNNDILQLINQIVFEKNIRKRLPDRIFESIWCIISQQDKLKLLNKQIISLDVNTINKYLNDLGEPFSFITKSLKKVKIEYTADVLALAKELTYYRYISSYSELYKDKKIKYIQFNTKNRSKG